MQSTHQTFGVRYAKKSSQYQATKQEKQLSSIRKTKITQQKGKCQKSPLFAAWPRKQVEITKVGDKTQNKICIVRSFFGIISWISARRWTGENWHLPRLKSGKVSRTLFLFESSFEPTILLEINGCGRAEAEKCKEKKQQAEIAPIWIRLQAQMSGTLDQPGHVVHPFYTFGSNKIW